MITKAKDTQDAANEGRIKDDIKKKKKKILKNIIYKKYEY